MAPSTVTASSTYMLEYSCAELACFCSADSLSAVRLSITRPNNAGTAKLDKVDISIAAVAHDSVHSSGRDSSAIANTGT
jgi:hypothetical protein